MDEETFAKLHANIDTSGHYPPLIVRSLELSIRFADEFKQGKYQLLDGEHRWRDQSGRGAEEIEVRVWTGISDDRAVQLLLTLNRLQGEDDKKKRNALIRDLYQLESDPEALSSLLPEDVKTITAIVQEASRAAVTDAQDRAKSISRQEPITIWSEPDQAEVIRRALRYWLTAEDPDDRIQNCREGAALAAICGAYLESQGASGDPIDGGASG